MNRFKKYTKNKVRYFIKKINDLLISFGIFKKKATTPNKTPQKHKKYFIKYHGEIIAPNKALQNTYDNACVGDIFFSLMPLSPDKLAKIEASHRVRPFMILKKKENTFLAIQSSSKPRIYHTENKKYGRMKVDNSYFNLEEIYEVPVNNIKQYLSSCSESEVEEVFRRMALLNLEGFEDLLGIKKVEPEVKEGDIILAGNNRYYVYSISEDRNMTCFRFSPYNPNTKLTKVTLNGSDYQVNTRKPSYFLNIKPRSIEMVADKNLKQFIDEKIEKETQPVKSSTISNDELKIGDIVSHKKNKYVIGDIDGDLFVIYKTFSKRETDDNYWYKLWSKGVNYFINLKHPVKTKLLGKRIPIDHVEVGSLEEVKQRLQARQEKESNYNATHWMDKYSFSNSVGTIYKHKILDDEYIYLYNKGYTAFMVNVAEFYDGDYMVVGYSTDFKNFEVTDKSLYTDDLKMLLDELIEIGHKDKRILEKIKEDLENDNHSKEN